MMKTDQTQPAQPHDIAVSSIDSFITSLTQLAETDPLAAFSHVQEQAQALRAKTLTADEENKYRIFFLNLAQKLKLVGNPKQRITCYLHALYLWTHCCRPNWTRTEIFLLLTDRVGRNWTDAHDLQAEASDPQTQADNPLYCAALFFLLAKKNRDVEQKVSLYSKAAYFAALAGFVPIVTPNAQKVVNLAPKRAYQDAYDPVIQQANPLYCSTLFNLLANLAKDQETQCYLSRSAAEYYQQAAYYARNAGADRAAHACTKWYEKLDSEGDRVAAADSTLEEPAPSTATPQPTITTPPATPVSLSSLNTPTAPMPQTTTRERMDRWRNSLPEETFFDSPLRRNDSVGGYRVKQRSNGEDVVVIPFAALRPS